MKSYSWILILVLFLSGFSSCHSDSEKYKDILKKMSGLDYWLSSPGVQEGTAAFV